tara:strand:+ start:137 stop:523 length:387 start_codon:yes stop_codon:yes gene_type:complete
MRINSQEDFMKHALATAMTITMNRAVREGLKEIYERALAFEKKNNHKTTVEDMKNNTMEFLNMASSKMPIPIPEELDIEEIGECFGGWLWCLNMVEAVEDNLGMMEAMSEIHNLVTKLEERDFQEKNR